MTVHALAKEFAVPSQTPPDKAAPWTDSVVSTSRADIAVRQSAGAKLPILLLHPEGGSKRMFDALLEGRLGREYRMIAIDLPGHGGSSNAHDPETYTPEGCADAALEVLERLGIDAAVVFDASPDGRIGREMMTIFPGLLGLAIQGTRGEEAAEADARIFEMPIFHDGMLDLMMKSMEIKHVALQATPSLWYGG